MAFDPGKYARENAERQRQHAGGLMKQQRELMDHDAKVMKGHRDQAASVSQSIAEQQRLRLALHAKSARNRSQPG